MVGVQIDAQRAGAVRFQETFRVGGILASFAHRDNGQRGNSMLKLCERRQFAHARRAPRGPEIEKDVAAIETGERQALASRIQKWGGGDPLRLIDRKEFRKRGRALGALVDSLRPHRI